MSTSLSDTVDEMVLAILRRALPKVRNPVTGKDEDPVHDGQPVVDKTSKIVTYALPYVVYTSNFGDDGNWRNRRMTRRSMVLDFTYVGLNRWQVKWAQNRVRDQLLGLRPDIAGVSSWPIDLQLSTRVFRDDDAIRPDGSPLYYANDQMSLAHTLNRFPLQQQVGATP